MKRIIKLFLGLSLIMFLNSCTKDGEKGVDCQQVNLQQDALSEILPNRYMIRLNPEVLNFVPSGNYPERTAQAQKVVDAFLKSAGLTDIQVQRYFASVFLGCEMLCSENSSRRLRSMFGVLTVEPVQSIQLAQNCTGQVVNMTKQSSSYGARRVGMASGSGKRIWIVDTGLDYDHPDLNVNVALSRNFQTGSAAGLTGEAAINDENGHGTHVGGIAAAKNNDIGTIGVAFGAELVALKVLDDAGSGNIANIVQAMDYLMVAGTPGEAVNISLGGGANTLVDLSVQQVASRGLLFAIAAGNDSKNASNTSPARVNGQGIYTVSAIDDKDRFAFYSNFGNPPVDVAQPGSGILSTYLNGQYIFLSGTSMATPHMAGVLALKGRNFKTSGVAQNDPDGNADPIAVVD